MKSKICNILKSNKGETLAEVLVSILIMALGMTMLAGGLITTAKINRSASSKNIIVFADKNTATEIEDMEISIIVNNESQFEKYKVKVYSNISEDAQENDLESQRKLLFYE